MNTATIKSARERNASLLKFLSYGRTFAAGGLLSVAVVNVFYDLASKPLPDSATTWAVWIGGVAVVVAGKVIDLASA